MRFIHFAPPAVKYPQQGWEIARHDAHRYVAIDNDRPVYDPLGAGAPRPPEGLPSWQGHFPGWALEIRKADESDRRTHRDAPGISYDVIGRADLKPTQRIVEFSPAVFGFYWRGLPSERLTLEVFENQGPGGSGFRNSTVVGRASFRHGLLEIPGSEVGRLTLEGLGMFEHLRAFALSEPPFTSGPGG